MDDASAVTLWGVLGGVVVARLYLVVSDWHRFEDDLGNIPKIWEGGLGIPGGLLFGISVGLWVAHRRGISPGVAATCAAPAIPLAQAIGRWGNYFNQELYGEPTDLPWALEIDPEHLLPGYDIGTTFHPTFLYESLWSLGLVFVLLWIDRRFRLHDGSLMAVYLIGYGIGRFWIEGLRIDEADVVAGLRWNQWVSLAAVAGGVIWLVLAERRPFPEKPDAPVGADTTDTGSAETEPGDGESTVADATGTEPGDPESADTEPDGTESAETEPGDGESTVADAADTEPGDVGSTAGDATAADLDDADSAVDPSDEPAAVDGEHAADAADDVDSDPAGDDAGERADG